MNQVFEENKKFFSLPEQEKRRIVADENNRCPGALIASHCIMSCSSLCSSSTLHYLLDASALMCALKHSM